MSIPWVSAYLSKLGGLPELEFHTDVTDAPKQFLGLLQQVGTRLVACVETPLDESTYDDAISSLSEAGGDEDLLAEARECRAQVGRLAAIEVRAIAMDPPIVITFQQFAPWFELMFGDNDDDIAPETNLPAQSDPEIERRRKEQTEWTRERRTAVARKAASDPRFPKCKDEASRVHLLTMALAGDLPADEYLLKEISREAKAIYELEIK